MKGPQVIPTRGPRVQARHEPEQPPHARAARGGLRRPIHGAAAVRYIRSMLHSPAAMHARERPSPDAGSAFRPSPTSSRRCFLTCLWAFPGVARARDSDAPARRPAEVTVGVGETLPDGPLLGLNGPSHRLRDFLGHSLIINVWASWCGPCRQEMSSLERLAWRENERSFNIIGISTDDDAAAARRLLESSNATLGHFIDSHLYWETLLGASRLPLTVLVDARGRVIEKVYGARQWDGPEASRLISVAFGAGKAAATR
jgi:thiol-disulfide isomerase/thioredoxin